MKKTKYWGSLKIDFIKKHWKNYKPKEESLPSSDIRKKVWQAIIKQREEDPKDRFRIIEIKDGQAEVYVQWDKNDSEFLTISIIK